MPENYDVSSGDDAHRNAAGHDRPDGRPTSGEPPSADSRAASGTPSDAHQTSSGPPDQGHEGTTRLSAGQLGEPGDTDPTPKNQFAGDLTEQQSPQDGTRRMGQEPPEADNERTETIPAVPASAPAQNYASATDFIGTPGFVGSSGQAAPGDFPEFDPERTQTIPKVPAEEPSPWAFAGGIGGGFPTDPAEPAPEEPRRNRSGPVRAGIAAGIAVGVLVLLYVGDLLFSSGQVPRGTTVADVQIGGLTEAAAQQKLQKQLGTSLQEPVQLTAGDAKASISPEEAGLRMDWAATVDRAGSQPLNPITRVTSMFTTRDIAPVSTGDRQQLTQAIEQVKPKLDRAPAEGTIKFEGATPVAVQPQSGRTIDVASAADAVLQHWASNGPVRVPFNEQPVSTTSQGVQQALRDVAQPAVSGPVTVRGEGHDAALAPETIAAALRFQPDGDGGLRSSVDIPTVVAGVEPQLRDTIKPGKNAEIVLEGGKPVVRPSIEGRGVDWNKSFENLNDVLKKPGDRSVQALYQHQPAAFTTEQANQLGIREPISEFQTGGFEPASGMNIRRVAEQVNGAIIKPGDTFSLNGHTGPRGVPQGYVESGIIEDGRPAKAVGGGISQFATTLYNASYFAGVKDVEHKEHSYYISRYPAGREATVFQNPDGSSVIDVKFKNTLASGVMITTEWTPSSIKIKFWGTKQYDVTSQTSPQSEPTPPQQKVVPPGQPCSPSVGKPGFTVYDTRTLRDVRTGKVITEKPSKTKYDPHPIIHCNAAPPPPAPR